MRRFAYLGIGLAWLACSAGSVAFGAGPGGIGSSVSTPPAGSGVGTSGNTGALGSGIGSAPGVGAGSPTIGPAANSGNSGTVGSGGNLGTSGVNAGSTFGNGSFGSPFPGEAAATLQGPAGAGGNTISPTGQTGPQGAAGAVEDQNASSNPGQIGQGKLGGELPGRTGTSNDNWRWRFFSGLWWYWMPNTNQWMYYQNGSWQLFNGPVEGISTAQSQMQIPYSTGYRGTNVNGSVNGAPGTNSTSGIGAGAITPGAGGQNGNLGAPATGTTGTSTGPITSGPRAADRNNQSGTEGIPPNVDNGPEMPKERAGAGTAAAGGVRLK
jgi:hypothetical protein